MDEMLEMTAEALETSEITELENMYREAYEAALKDGATDMAEFYKGKLEALENGAETAEGSDIRDMYLDAYDAAVKNGATDMAEFYRKKLGIGDNEISFGSRTDDIVSDSRELRKLEQEYERAKRDLQTRGINIRDDMRNEVTMERTQREIDRIKKKHNW